MANYNRNRDYSHYAGDDNWDKYEDRYGYEGNYGQGQGNYNRVHYVPDNDDNRWEPQGLGSRRGWRESDPYRSTGGYNEQSGRGNMNYGGGYQNQYAQGPLRRDYPYENRERQDRGYAYSNTGLNDEYDRSYYGSYRRDEDYNRDYDSARNRRAEYNRGNWAGDRFRDEDRWRHTGYEGSSWGRTDERRHMDGPYRGKGPKGYSRSLDRIREDVCERLADDRLDASNIDVHLEGTEVVLEGTVETKRDKRRAEDLVENVPGVTDVQNHLVVGTPTTNAVIAAVAGRNTSTDANRRVKDANK
jgi:hypothetical protein